ncbi:hypothetical protein [Hyphomicrobium sp.]|uniref:hypothetical protein n=1 Tax=Hyphomicrobium sp. TaxID=82 RepID=UPI002FE0AE99
MPLHIQQSDWIVHDGTLKKQFGYTGLMGDGAEHILQIHIDTSPNMVLGGYHTHISLHLYPNYLEGDPGYVPAQLAADDAPAEAKVVTVRCGPSGNGALMIMPMEREGSESFLATLNKCKMMRLTLFDDNGPFMRLPIPNDEQYRRAAREYFAQAEGVPSKEAMLGMLRPQRSFLSRLASKFAP